MLFKTLAEIQGYIPVGNGTDFNRLKPSLENADTAFLRPLLQGMFDELQEFYDAATPKPEDPDQAVIWDDMTDLVSKSKKAEIHLAYWMGFQALNATISDSGFKRTESDKMKSLFKYQEDNLQGYFKEVGFNALDELLEYLEEHISSFAEWANTENYTLIKQAFIPNTVLFNKLININNSRLTFMRLVPHLNLVEDLDIKPIIGKTYLEYIKTEMVKAEPATKVTALLPYVRKPMAYLSSAYLMEESGADLTERGLYFEATRAIDNNSTERAPASDNRIDILVKRNRSIGQAYLDQLKSYLAANAEDWPDYAGGASTVIRRDNTDKKTFWNPVR